MTDLLIPGCPYRPGRGDAWPTHSHKARNKTADRKRVMSQLAKIQREDDERALRGSI